MPAAAAGAVTRNSSGRPWPGTGSAIGLTETVWTGSGDGTWRARLTRSFYGRVRFGLAKPGWRS